MSYGTYELVEATRVSGNEKRVLQTLVTGVERNFSAAEISGIWNRDTRDIRRAAKMLAGILPHYGWQIKTKMGRHGGYSLTPISPHPVIDSTDQREVA